jgi:hypothetical protein
VWWFCPAFCSRHLAVYSVFSAFTSTRVTKLLDVNWCQSSYLQGKIKTP